MDNYTLEVWLINLDMLSLMSIYSRIGCARNVLFD